MKIEHIISELGPARKTKATATTAATPPVTPTATPKPRVRKTTATTAATPPVTPTATPKPRVRKTTATTAATPPVTPAVQPTTAQAPAQPATQNVSGTSSNWRNEPGIGSQIATGVGKVARGVGQFVQGTGNLASQVAGAVTQPIGAAIGGIKKGFRTANRGGTFRMPQSGGDVTEPTSAGLGQDEFNELKSMIQRLDQRLTNAGIKENKKR